MVLMLSSLPKIWSCRWMWCKRSLTAQGELMDVQAYKLTRRRVSSGNLTVITSTRHPPSEIRLG
jgi:hypothetical protein